MAQHLTRNKQLDVLRCVAVLSVMCHHREISRLFTRSGWIGVDLFFVLSGFLISGLLFSEYKSRHSIDFQRFFIRRGFKIYPSYYLFLALSGAVCWFSLNKSVALQEYFYEFLFLQNFKRTLWTHIWGHTWSVAVEEHFYIFLPTLLLALSRRKRRREDPFTSIPLLFAAVAVISILSRAFFVYGPQRRLLLAWFATNARMDALFFGVLLGYLYHFHRERLELVMGAMKTRVSIALISTLLISISYFVTRDSRLFSTIGFTFIYLACGGILLLSITMRPMQQHFIGKALSWLADAMAYVGMFSYSIYLWHLPINFLISKRVLHADLGRYGGFGLYMIASIAIGIMMSKLIEYPALRVRDRLFPARSKDLVVSAPSSRLSGAGEVPQKAAVAASATANST